MLKTQNTMDIKKVLQIYKPITNKKRDIKIVLLANDKLNYSYFSLNENVSVNDTPREFDEMKEEVRSLRT